jgi:hypothetical protein
MIPITAPFISRKSKDPAPADRGEYDGRTINYVRPRSMLLAKQAKPITFASANAPGSHC